MTTTIRKFSFAVLITVWGAFTANAQNATMWKLDKAHTSVNFSINHFFSSVTGNFKTFDGNFQFDPNNLKGSKANFNIAVKSVNTGDGKRDKHLQSADFFEANSYPNISFKSTKIESVSKTEFLVHGRLTIREKTKDIILPLKVTGEMEHPMMKGTLILGMDIETVISRTDFGVGTGSWAATMVVGDEVRIHIPMELNRMK